MTAGILVGHGQFAQGLYSALCAIVGEPTDFTVIVFEGKGRADIEQAVREAHNRISGQPAVIFTDLQGGSSTTICSCLVRECRDVGLVCGANLPMLIKFVQHRERLSLQELLTVLGDAGREGIRSLKPTS